MSPDEIAVMDNSKCILQVQGIRPFFSDKYDITRHPQYKKLSDYHSKNRFDVKRYLSHYLKVQNEDQHEVYEVEMEWFCRKKENTGKCKGAMLYYK